jgi:hypothetical protein
LNFSFAKSPGDCPAGPSAVFSAVYAVYSLFNRRGADSKFIRVFSARLPSALPDFPTILFFVRHIISL